MVDWFIVVGIIIIVLVIAVGLVIVLGRSTATPKGTGSLLTPDSNNFSDINLCLQKGGSWVVFDGNAIGTCDIKYKIYPNNSK